MSRALLLAPLALLALVVGAAVADPPANPFEGSWQGPYTRLNGDQTGTLEITVDSNGKIRGTAEDSVLGSTIVRGKMHPTGVVRMSFKSDVGNGALHGTATFNAAGNIVLVVENPSTGALYEGELAP